MLINYDGEGFSAFALYNALQLHFSSKSYDFIKYHGKTQVSKDTFLKRKDKFYFYKLSRKYNEKDLLEFYLANMIDGQASWVGDMLNENGDEAYRKWKKKKESLSYVFSNDVDWLFNQVKNPNELLFVKSGRYPKLLQFLMQGEIQIETICILNKLMNFLEMWNKRIDDDIIYPNWSLKICKYTPFIEYTETKYKLLLTNKLKEYE